MHQDGQHAKPAVQMTMAVITMAQLARAHST